MAFTLFSPITLLYSSLNYAGFTLFPIIYETYSPNLNPPSIVSLTSLNDINDGEEAFIGVYNGFYLAVYASLIFPADSIGNFSLDGINWTPAANNTDPPSHFILIIKDFLTDSTYYPTFDMWNNNFGMAWIENNPLCRFNLKYNDIPPNVPVTIPSPPPPFTGSQQIYIKPNIGNVRSSTKTQNIPLNDIIITDQSGGEFGLNAFPANNPIPMGYEMTLPQTIKSVKFSQTFRENSTVGCQIGTAVQAGTPTTPFIPSYPLPNISVTIYYGETQTVYASVTTDSNGKFSLDMKAGNYVFEIFITSPSISFYQMIL